MEEKDKKIENRKKKSNNSNTINSIQRRPKQKIKKTTDTSWKWAVKPDENGMRRK